MRLARLWHHHQDFLRAHDLTNGHGDGLLGNFFQSTEPSFVHLLLPTSFVEFDYEVRLFRLEIRGRVVECQVTILSNARKNDVDAPGSQSESRRDRRR